MAKKKAMLSIVVVLMTALMSLFSLSVVSAVLTNLDQPSASTVTGYNLNQIVGADLGMNLSGLYSIYNANDSFIISDSDGFDVFRACLGRLVVTNVDQEEYLSFEGKTIYLTSDIDFNSSVIYPIGYDYNEYHDVNVFRGTFEGGYHTLKNLNIRSGNEGVLNSDHVNIGLFGRLSGTVRCLKLSNVTVYDYKCYIDDFNMGIIAGKSEGATIDECIVENCTINFNGTSSGYVFSDNIGGIVGTANSSSSISNSIVVGINITGNTTLSHPIVSGYHLLNNNVKSCVVYGNNGVSFASNNDETIICSKPTTLASLTANSSNSKAFSSSIVSETKGASGTVYYFGEDTSYYLGYSTSNGYMPYLRGFMRWDVIKIQTDGYVDGCGVTVSPEIDSSDETDSWEYEDNCWSTMVLSDRYNSYINFNEDNETITVLDIDNVDYRNFKAISRITGVSFEKWQHSETLDGFDRVHTYIAKFDYDFYIQFGTVEGDLLPTGYSYDYLQFKITQGNKTIHFEDDGTLSANIPVKDGTIINVTNTGYSFTTNGVSYIVIYSTAVKPKEYFSESALKDGEELPGYVSNDNQSLTVTQNGTIRPIYDWTTFNIAFGSVKYEEKTDEINGSNTEVSGYKYDGYIDMFGGDGKNIGMIDGAGIRVTNSTSYQGFDYEIIAEESNTNSSNLRTLSYYLNSSPFGINKLLLCKYEYNSEYSVVDTGLSNGNYGQEFSGEDTAIDGFEINITPTIVPYQEVKIEFKPATNGELAVVPLMMSTAESGEYGALSTFTNPLNVSAFYVGYVISEDGSTCTFSYEEKNIVYNQQGDTYTRTTEIIYSMPENYQGTYEFTEVTYDNTIVTKFGDDTLKLNKSTNESTGWVSVTIEEYTEDVDSKLTFKQAINSNTKQAFGTMYKGEYNNSDLKWYFTACTEIVCEVPTGDCLRIESELIKNNETDEYPSSVAYYYWIGESNNYGLVKYVVPIGYSFGNGIDDSGTNDNSYIGYNPNQVIQPTFDSNTVTFRNTNSDISKMEITPNESSDIVTIGNEIVFYTWSYADESNTYKLEFTDITAVNGGSTMTYTFTFKRTLNGSSTKTSFVVTYNIEAGDSSTEYKYSDVDSTISISKDTIIEPKIEGMTIPDTGFNIIFESITIDNDTIAPTNNNVRIEDGQKVSYSTYTYIDANNGKNQFIYVVTIDGVNNEVIYDLYDTSNGIKFMHYAIVKTDVNGDEIDFNAFSCEGESTIKPIAEIKNYGVNY